MFLCICDISLENVLAFDYVRGLSSVEGGCTDGMASVLTNTGPYPLLRTASPEVENIISYKVSSWSITIKELEMCGRVYYEVMHPC